VREAKDGEAIVPNRVYIAPGDFHMTVDSRDGNPFVRLNQAAPENHCRPAADPMLRSIAGLYGSAALAVVLTGMGEDGRRGCSAVRERGGRVLIQDEPTSIVWGMPGAVAAAGLANWNISTQRDRRPYWRRVQGGLMIAARDYTFLSELVHRQSGLHLGAGKEYLIESRLTPVAATLGVASLDALITYLVVPRSRRT
jgi:hypothetical protein